MQRLAVSSSRALLPPQASAHRVRAGVIAGRGLSIRFARRPPRRLLSSLLTVRVTVAMVRHAVLTGSTLGIDGATRAAVACPQASLLLIAAGSTVSPAGPASHSSVLDDRRPRREQRFSAIVPSFTTPADGPASQCSRASKSARGRRGGIIPRITRPTPFPTGAERILVGGADIEHSPRTTPFIPWVSGARGVTTVRTVTLLLALLAGRGGSCCRRIPRTLDKPW